MSDFNKMMADMGREMGKKCAELYLQAKEVLDNPITFKDVYNCVALPEGYEIMYGCKHHGGWMVMACKENAGSGEWIEYKDGFWQKGSGLGSGAIKISNLPVQDAAGLIPGEVLSKAMKHYKGL